MLISRCCLTDKFKQNELLGIATETLLMSITWTIFYDYTMNFKNNYIHKLKFISVMIFYRLSLDFSYVFFVSQLYQYAGFKLTFVFSTYILSWFLYLMSIFLTNSKIDKVSDSFFLMAVLSVFAPLTSLYGLDVREIFPVIATISSYTIVYFISTYWHSYTSNYSFLVDGRLITITVSIVSVLLFVVWIFASGVISNANLNFSKVYEFRESNSKVLNIGILSYLNIWVTKIFNIFAIAFCLHKKKYLLAAIFILLQILFFSVLVDFQRI